jgi:LysM repeat protein
MLVACERPLQEVPEATTPPTVETGPIESTIPAPPTPEPTGGEELPPGTPEGGDTTAPTEGEATPIVGEGATDAGDATGEGEAAGEEGEDTAGATGEGTYTVQAGDTLFSIATSYGLTVDELAAANGIENVNFIDVGQVLIIPAPSGTTDETEAGETGEEAAAGDEATEGEEAATGEEQTYIVKPGDILGRIAQQFGVTAENLAAYNDIDVNAIIYPGDVLRIPPPDWTAPEP